MVIMRGSVWQTESVSVCVCVCFSCLPTLSWPRGHRRKCPAHAASDEYQKLQCTVLSLSPSSNQTHNRLHRSTNLKQEVGCMFYFQTKTATSDVFGTSSDINCCLRGDCTHFLPRNKPPPPPPPLHLRPSMQCLTLLSRLLTNPPLICQRLLMTWRGYDAQITCACVTRREIRCHPLGVTSTEKLGENYSQFSFYGKLYTALKPAHKDKSWRRLMWPRPIFVLHRPSVYVWSSPYFHSWVHLLCLFRSVQQLPLLQSCPCFLSTPPPTLPSLCALFSFIHILLPQQRQTQSSHRAGALPHYNLSPCFYLHSSCFASSGDFTFISSSFTLNSSLPPSISLCRCLSVSSLFSPRSCAPHCSPFPPPPQFALYSLFISRPLSLSLASFSFLTAKSCNEVWQTSTLLP